MLFFFKNISASTTASLSAARFFETTSPVLLKICSLGTDVGGNKERNLLISVSRCVVFINYPITVKHNRLWKNDRLIGAAL